jgi:integrase/recombinase XerD
MRLFNRNGIYYVEFARGDKRSLKTSDEKEARIAYKKLRREWLQGRLILLESESSITLEEFRKEYLKSRESMSAKTRAHDKLSLEKLTAAFGNNFPLKMIDSKKIEEFKQICLAGTINKKGKPIKPVSVNSYLRQIKGALSAAVESGYIKTRPKIKMIRTGRHLPRYLRPAEIEALIKKAEELRPLFVPFLKFYLWTGARRNEGLALTWRDCQIEGNRPRAILTGKGNRQRSVPLAPQIVQVLETIQKDTGYVFPHIHESTVTHWFKAIVRACDPPIEARLHDLRHSAATYMLANGIPIKMVQEILGHAQLSTTAIYTEVIKEHLHIEMQKLKFDF